LSTIVLAHGLFGFGDLLPGILSFLPSVHYFNGVAEHLRDAKHTVLEPQVNPIGSIQSRANQLADKILKQADPTEKVHIIAHSMGGLDARCAIAQRPDLAGRVATLVTIGTPHRGSPVADAVMLNTGPLLNRIPDFLKQKLKNNAGAMRDLTTAACIAFDESTPDASSVRYINVAGDASKAGNELFLLQLASSIGSLTGEINDGVVTKSSALRPGNQHLADWPTDHSEEIGWSKALLSLQREKAMADHLARYDAIVDLL
jgi:triacylglycerol lipase